MVVPLYLFKSRTEVSSQHPLESAIDLQFSMRDMLSIDELAAVEGVWNAPDGPGSRGWKNNPLAWLRDTTNGLSFGCSEYAIYLALASRPDFFSQDMKKTFCGAVGCSVMTTDGYVIVQQRASGLLAPGMLDSSAAGMMVIQDGKLDITSRMEEKLRRELSLDTVALQITGTHGSQDYMSAQVTYACCAPFDFQHLKEIVNPKFAERVIGVKRAELGDFLVSHYVGDNDLHIIGDGLGVFLSSMEQDEKEYYIQLLNTRGAKISYAMLRDGIIEECGG